MLNIREYKKEIEDYVFSEKELFSKLKNKIILITGAAGLIGSYLSDLLITSNMMLNLSLELILIDRNGALLSKRFHNDNYKFVQLLVCDINSEVLNQIGNVDYIFHCASNTSPIDYSTKPIDTILTNVIGTNNILKLCVLKKAKRILFCSSVEAYGQNNGDVDDFTEDYSGYVNCNTLRANYPSAKRCAEALLNAYKSEYPNLNFYIARIGRIYGPTVILNDSKAPTQFILNAVHGEDIILKSNGMQEYSWGYVGDCAMALLYILVRGESGEAYNVSDSNSKTTLLDFAKACASSSNVKVVFSDQTDIEKKSFSKITKATLNVNKLESLGWSAKYDVEDGIKRTVKYLKTEAGL